MSDRNDRSTISYGKAFGAATLAALIWLCLLHVLFFATVFYKAHLFYGKSCEVVQALGATLPYDAEPMYQSCPDQIWNSAFFRAALSLVGSVTFWLPLIVIGGAVWKPIYERSFRQRPFASAIVALILLPLPAAIIHALLLGVGFTLEQTPYSSWP